MEGNKKLIYAEDLRQAVVEDKQIQGKAFAAIMRHLNAAPAVDAVEVVRCKDYKHKGWIQEPCHGKSVDYCRVLDFCINNTDKCFCSYGERREGE